MAASQVVLGNPADQQIVFAQPVPRTHANLDGHEYSSVAKPCDHAKNLKIALVVIAVLALLVGVVGLLSNIGVLDICVNGGSLAPHALPTMLAGFGGTLVATATFTVLQLKKKYDEAKRAPENTAEMESRNKSSEPEVTN